MAKPALALKEKVAINRRIDDVYAALVDPSVLIRVIGARKIRVRKLPDDARWIMTNPEKLGDREIRLHLAETSKPNHLKWVSEFRGFEVVTLLTLEADGGTKTRLRLASETFPTTLRARLMAPILKLGESRVKRGVRTGLKQLAQNVEQAARI